MVMLTGSPPGREKEGDQLHGEPMRHDVLQKEEIADWGRTEGTVDTVEITKKRRKGDDHQAENEERIQEPFALECKHRVKLNWNLEIKMR